MKFAANIGLNFQLSIKNEFFLSKGIFSPIISMRNPNQRPFNKNSRRPRWMMPSTTFRLTIGDIEITYKCFQPQSKSKGCGCFFSKANSFNQSQTPIFSYLCSFKFSENWKKRFRISPFAMLMSTIWKTSVYRFQKTSLLSSRDYRVRASRRWLSTHFMPKVSAVMWRAWVPTRASSWADWTSQMWKASPASRLPSPSNRR